MTDPCKVTVKAGALNRALKASIPHADAKAASPRMNTVRLEALAGSLAVIASDGWTLGCYRIPEAVVDQFDLLLTLKDAKTLQKLVQSAHNIHDVEILVEGGRVKFAGFGFEWETRNILDTVTPIVWQLAIINNLDSNPLDITGCVAGYAADKLARFRSAGDLLVFRHGADLKATLVEAENFIGLILPRRVEQPEPAWWIPGSTAPYIVDADVAS